MSYRAQGLAVACLAVAVLFDLLIGAERPGWYAFLGLGGCLVIIVVSKWLGKVWLQRRPDYYERLPEGDREPHA